MILFTVERQGAAYAWFRRFAHFSLDDSIDIRFPRYTLPPALLTVTGDAFDTPRYFALTMFHANILGGIVRIIRRLAAHCAIAMFRGANVITQRERYQDIIQISPLSSAPACLYFLYVD